MFKSNNSINKTMLDRSDLAARLTYHGGIQHELRMQNGKERALRRALIHSYQGCTIQLDDGREFRALMNPVKNSEDKDIKQLSIPYKDIQLNDIPHGKTIDGRVTIGIKPGDVFVWKETNTHWLVFLEFIEEDAYFRAQVIRCDQWIMIDGTKYWCHVRSALEATLDWKTQNSIIRNNPNYHLIMYITRNQQTDDYFHRFSKIKVGQVENTWEGGEHFKNWEIISRNPYAGDGVLALYLKEDYSNTIAEAEADAQQQVPPPPEQDMSLPYIDAPKEVEIYSTFTAILHNVSDLSGSWSISNTKAKIVENLNDSVQIKVVTGKSGTFDIKYGDLIHTVKILPA